MSKTPRTDARPHIWTGPTALVDAEFAEDLERELIGFCDVLDADPTLEPSGRVVDAMMRLQRMQRDLAAALAALKGCRCHMCRTVRAALGEDAT